ncbi:DUF6174 domain-containing protein [Streptomyces sp. NPDC006314]|uniref:DUF6174 domain-containing protein n=1 Tax=Streptomyces sp. NPDC006314 TaxID=3154475 RepID=UPI0033ADD4AF
MIAGHSRARFLSTAALIGTLLCLVPACDAGSSASSKIAEGSEPERAGVQGTAAWEEPDSYVYTLTSTTQVLAGTFRVEVGNGTVTNVVGLDEDSRRQVREHVEVPTLGQLLKRLEQARRDNAETAEATYAADGHPVRISLDWDENAIDDESLYVISAYQPASAGRVHDGKKEN